MLSTFSYCSVATNRSPPSDAASDLARAADLGDAEVYVTGQLPYAFVPVSDAPLQLLVGRTLLASLSHDLKTPLTALNASAQLALRRMLWAPGQLGIARQ